MKTVWMMAIAAAVTLAAAAAQDTVSVQERTVIKKMLSDAEVLGAKGGFLSAAVKGAPYSGEEVTEFTQVLADGTNIHNETHTLVYRDGDGRVRRETPDSVTIWDPVANASYFLNTKDQTYRQMPLAVQFMTTSVSKDGRVGVTMRMGNGMAGGGPVMMSAAPGGAPPPPPPGGGQFFFTQGLNRVSGADQAPAESLGRQTMEGVPADGTRRVDTIEEGAIGNDRPIQITSERWYSPDLRTVMMTRHSDPRTGEEIFRLTNVTRGDQPANLFTVPPGYQKLENK
ncbi:MAG TPA: hypothetical protein VME43_26580 [Bryobacteraceae bacterium]|nr:hypothetical protein [Bryobacteraceae bacterium]